MPATMAAARPVGMSRMPPSVSAYRPRPGRSGSQTCQAAEKQTMVIARPATATARQGRIESLMGRSAIVMRPTTTTTIPKASTGSPHGVARAPFTPSAARRLRFTSCPVETLAQGRNTEATTARPSTTITAPSPIQSVRVNARRGRLRPAIHAGHVLCSTTADLLERRTPRARSACRYRPRRPRT